MKTTACPPTRRTIVLANILVALAAYLVTGIGEFRAHGDTVEEDWASFRKQFPFHIQSLVLSPSRPDGTRTLLITEPPPMATLEGMKTAVSGKLADARIFQHPIGVDGWVRDVAVSAPTNANTLFETVARLSTYLFGSSYKAHVLELPLPARETARQNLDLKVDSHELHHWLADDALFVPVDSNQDVPLRSIRQSRETAVYYSKDRGLVAWWLPTGTKLSSHRGVIRQFTIDSDLLVGGLIYETGLMVIGRERITPLHIIQPLRTEMLISLANITETQLSQSYERTYPLAGRFDDHRDWAPILLSPQLRHTEYGSLLNITDQLLKGWSMKGLIKYERFPYEAPASFPFDNTPLYFYLTKKLNDPFSSLLFNWNTTGSGYAVDYPEHQVVALNRTGALPVTYMPDEERAFPNKNESQAFPIIRQAMEDGYAYFASLSDPNLVRVLQYSAFYQLFRAAAWSPTESVPAADQPEAELRKLFAELLNRIGSDSPSLINEFKARYSADNQATNSVGFRKRFLDFQNEVNRISAEEFRISLTSYGRYNALADLVMSVTLMESTLQALPSNKLLAQQEPDTTQRTERAFERIRELQLAQEPYWKELARVLAQRLEQAEDNKVSPDEAKAAAARAAEKRIEDLRTKVHAIKPGELEAYIAERDTRDALDLLVSMEEAFSKLPVDPLAPLTNEAPTSVRTERAIERWKLLASMNSDKIDRLSTLVVEARSKRWEEFQKKYGRTFFEGGTNDPERKASDIKQLNKSLVPLRAKAATLDETRVKALARLSANRLLVQRLRWQIPGFYALAQKLPDSGLATLPKDLTSESGVNAQVTAVEWLANASPAIVDAMVVQNWTNKLDLAVDDFSTEVNVCRTNLAKWPGRILELGIALLDQAGDGEMKMEALESALERQVTQLEKRLGKDFVERSINRRAQELLSLLKQVGELSAQFKLGAFQSTYPARVRDQCTAWMKTPCVVISEPTGDATMLVGGHDVDSTVTRFKIATDPDFKAGTVKVVTEDGHDVLLVHPDDAGRIVPNVRKAAQSSAKSGKPLSAAERDKLVTEMQQAVRNTRPTPIRPIREALGMQAAAPVKDRGALPLVNASGRASPVWPGGHWRNYGEVPETVAKLRTEIGGWKPPQVILTRQADGTCDIGFPDGTSWRAWNTQAAIDLCVERVRPGSSGVGEPVGLHLDGFNYDEARGFVTSWEVRSKAVKEAEFGVNPRKSGRIAAIDSQLEQRCDFAQAKITQRQILPGEKAARCTIEIPVKEGTPAKLDLLVRSERSLSRVVWDKVLTAVEKVVGLYRQKGPFRRDVAAQLRRDIKVLLKDMELESSQIELHFSSDMGDFYIVLDVVAPEPAQRIDMAVR
ncbi:MAG: hypothetical protein HZA90_26540 [Verrucomicrobia bacterium]|nr:hypothetical protein [Verrucomicrobiota bacterium]